MSWDPAQYERFRAERQKPFFDLVNMVRARPGMRVLDLGCGTGELTRAMHRRLGAAHTLGIDSSPAMLARATEGQEGAEPGVEFMLGDIAAVVDTGPGAVGGPRDLVLSNAALHWLPDHPRLIEGITALIAPGGQLAVQVPANHRHPSHLVADEVASEAPFCLALGGYRHGKRVLDAREYAELLHRVGYVELEVLARVYGHLLPSRDDVVEWVKGSLLTAYRDRMPAPLFAAFLARYRERLHEVLPDERPYLYTFERIFLWGLWRR